MRTFSQQPHERAQHPAASARYGAFHEGAEAQLSWLLSSGL